MYSRSNPTQNTPIGCRRVLKPFSHTQKQLNYFVSTNMSSFLHWTTVLFGLLFTLLKDTQYNPDRDFMKSQVQIRNKKVQIHNKKGPDPQQKGPDPQQKRSGSATKRSGSETLLHDEVKLLLMLREVAWSSKDNGRRCGCSVVALQHR